MFYEILIIEDEKELIQTITESLTKEHFIIEFATDFYSASEKIALYNYDCILLEIMIPHGSGLELLELLKKSDKSENVIIISAKDSLDDKLKDLELGADDYVAKPFHIAELNARIKAVLRRKTLKGKSTIKIINVVLDLKERLFFVNDKIVALNRKEFDILNYFMLNAK